MKYANLLGSLLLCGVLLCGCGTPAAAAADKGKLKSFRYSCGSYATGAAMCEIEPQGTGFSMELIEQSGSEEKQETRTLTQADMDALAKALQDTGAAKWDGFSERDESIVDGFTFSFSAEYEKGALSADGYGTLPMGYQDTHEALMKALWALGKS